jgi:far upstream element-binding protein
MQADTGCKINVSQPSGVDFEREIGLVGSRSAIDDAKDRIMEKVRAVVRYIHSTSFVSLLTI